MLRRVFASAFGSRPNRTCGRVVSVSTTTTPADPAALKAVETGMQRWVDELIVAENMCPFAAKSTYKFQIYPHQHDLCEETFSFFHKAVVETGFNVLEQHRLNTFVVFPFLSCLQGMPDDTESFLQFHYAAINQCHGLALTPEMEVNEEHGNHPQKEQQVVAMPFHPHLPKWYKQRLKIQPADSWHDTLPEERFYSACAPFPAIHLLRLQDLTAVRGKKLYLNLGTHNATWTQNEP